MPLNKETELNTVYFHGFIHSFYIFYLFSGLMTSNYDARSSIPEAEINFSFVNDVSPLTSLTLIAVLWRKGPICSIYPKLSGRRNGFMPFP